jgi:uncharacterized RDD family membrane protein YckC
MASSQLAPGAPPQPTFASLGRRIAAHLIDAVISLAIVLAASLAMRGFRAVGVWSPPAADPIANWRALGLLARLAVVIAFLVATGAIYRAFFEASAWQASIGKRLLNIYVTDDRGRRLGLARSLGRSFAKSFFNAIYPLGAISVATIAACIKKQALHDFVARTLVVDGRPVDVGTFELWRIVAAFGIPFLWIVVTFVGVFGTWGS